MLEFKGNESLTFCYTKVIQRLVALNKLIYN